MGNLLGIARRGKSRAPMEKLQRATISKELGLMGDCKGSKFPERQITILSIEDWTATLALLGGIDLDWTVRRANLLVSGIVLPRGRGSKIAIGDVVVEVRDQTSPCQQMENAQAGLRKALSGDWRGGVCCRVISGGEIGIGDSVKTILDVPETIIRLP
jgi:MOSC domain-containing protein YiiM